MEPSALDLAVRYASYPVAGLMLLSQVDELVIDLTYLAKGLHRADRRRLDVDALRALPARRIAILVPAWHEADVIEEMLEHNLATIDYPRGSYDIFCGTYPNDPATRERVEAVALRHPEVHRVEVPNDGPTSKADCLNAIWRGVRELERDRGLRFDIFVLHDAEDVIHPLALRLYSKLVPEHPAVQIPVFSLDRRCRDLVASTYIDEFSEFHLKELGARAELGGLVPSAGVGTAFGREAIEAIADGNGGDPFDTGNLTEDYDVALRLRLAGKGLHFACHTVMRPGETPDAKPREEYIATREYFPVHVRASIRQRARWICGIALQAWERFGWQGPKMVRYSLWRDRKGLLNGVLVLMAYVLFAYLLGREVHAYFAGNGWTSALVIPPGSFLEKLLLVNLFGLAWRAIWKFHFVRALHGWRHGLVALPRLVLANLVIIAATIRATRAYARHRATGEPLRWAKTAHTFPATEAVVAVSSMEDR